MAREPSGRDSSTGRLVAAAVVLAGLHLGLTQYFLPLSIALSDAPITGDDFDVHIGQTWRVLEGLDGWGKAWIYDVDLLAGEPAGVIFDGDNKGWSIWTFAVWKLGASKGLAFNLLVLLSFLACPVVTLASCRLFGYSMGASLVAAAMASTIWFFDSFAHWIWWIGMVAYGLAAFLALLPLALFYRFLEDRRLVHALWCAPLLGVAHLMHPYSFFILAPPMAALYLRDFKTLRAREHVAVGGIVLVTVFINLYWLLAAFAHWHYILDSAYFAQSGPSFLVADFFNILRNPLDTGVIGTRTAFRFVYLALGAGALVVWRRERDRRFLPFALALGVLLALTYLGPLIPGAGQVQPYRHALPASFFAAVAAAGFVEWLWQQRALAGLGRPAYAVLAVATMAGAQRLADDVLYFTPTIVPEAEPLFDDVPSPIMRYGFLSNFKQRTHVFYGFPRDDLVEHGVDDVVSWVETNIPAGGRVLVDNVLVGERIAWQTDVEVMGGFELRNLDHHYASFFRHYWGVPHVSELEIRDYLGTFGVGWVILQKPRADFDRARSTLEPVGNVGGRAVYRTRFPVSYFRRGRGKLHAQTNRIELSDTRPNEDVVIAYHWHEALVCKPGCSVEREQVQLDRVGFIRIPAPHPANMVIENSYRWP